MPKSKFVRFDDPEAAELLAKLAKIDGRTEGKEVIWLIRMEIARRTAPRIISSSESIPQYIPMSERG